MTIYVYRRNRIVRKHTAAKKKKKKQRIWYFKQSHDPLPQAPSFKPAVEMGRDEGTPILDELRSREDYTSYR